LRERSRACTVSNELGWRVDGVFRARDRRQLDVALKVLRPEFSAAVTELGFCARSNWSVVSSTRTCFALDPLGGGQVYVTAPWGRTLRHHLEENGALPIDQVITIAHRSRSTMRMARG
jgi:hypothetical protein